MPRYCLNCGTPLGVRTIEGRELQACASCDFVLWRDPKVVTMVVVEGERGILLGRRAIEPARGAWCLPGGFVNDDEHPAEAAARECREEIGADVEVTRLLGVLHVRKQGAASMVGIAYAARLRSGARPEAGEEMLEIAWFPLGDLPDLAFPSHREAVLQWARAGESSVLEDRR